MEELEFPSQIPTPSSPKLPTPKTPTKSASAGKKVFNLKRSKMVAPESPPKSPIIVSNKTVKFGKLPKTSKGSSLTVQGKNKKRIYRWFIIKSFLSGTFKHHSSCLRQDMLGRSSMCQWMGIQWRGRQNWPLGERFSSTMESISPKSNTGSPSQKKDSNGLTGVIRISWSKNIFACTAVWDIF